MSTTLSGLIAFENATPLEDSPSTISFNSQMWILERMDLETDHITSHDTRSCTYMTWTIYRILMLPSPLSSLIYE